MSQCLRGIIPVITDYLLDSEGIDWTRSLATWRWLLPAEFTVWLANRFGELFLVVPDGSVYMLEVGAGTLTKLAESRDDFCTKIDDGNNANEWLMIPMVDRMIATGFALQSGQCYGFKISPVLGGEYDVENCAPITVWDYLGAHGTIHEQIQNLPDGATVELKVVD